MQESGPGPLRDTKVSSAYEIGARIALGGFGAVYQARQRTTGQTVALKVLRKDRVESPDDVARFRREMELGALLHHPNIVRLIDSGETDDGNVFVVFEYVLGSNLADLIAAGRALRPDETVHLMAQVLDALACAHGHDVIHRDLKPANVMVTETGARRNAMVMDFGLGAFSDEAEWTSLKRLTERGEYMGTPAYSAPEQLLHGQAVPATDLYSWGLVFLECLSGRPAFDGPTPLVIHRQLGPEPVAMPEALREHELGRLLARVLQKDVSARETSAKRMLEALLALAEPLPPAEAFAPTATAAVATPTVRRTSSRERTQLSRIWSVPVRRNPNFKGRDALLDELHAALGGGEEMLVALRGLGGVGKTQLGIEYAYRFGKTYDVVAWVRAGDPESLTEDFSALAAPLGLAEQDTPDQRARIEAVRGWLERHSDWLVVFDNAPNPDAIRAFLPRTSTGNVLITSRHPSWRDLGLSIELEELGNDEAVEFLVQRTGDDDREAGAQLADALGRLPLALEEAAAYMEATGRPIRDYLALLRAQEEFVLEGVEDSASGSLRTTWEISFRQIDEETPEAADLLRLCSFLAPDSIPFDLLRQGKERLPEALGTALSDPRGLDRCVAALRRYSLVKVERDALTLHRLVQLATRERLAPQTREQWASAAVCVAEAGFPGGLAGDDQPESGRFLPHALASIEHARGLPSCVFETARLLNRTGNYLSARGFHDQGCQHLEHSATLLERMGEPQERFLASLLHDLSLVRFVLGELDTAAAHAERALEIDQRRRGGKHFRVALDLITLSWVLRSRGDLGRVRECSERALAIIESQFGADHPMLSMALSLLARAQWGLGEIVPARASADRAIAILTGQPLYHPLLCSSWNNLGHVLLDFGDIDGVDRCAERSLEIGLKAYGVDHALVALATKLRGCVQDRRGELVAARASFESAIACAERSCHYLHEDVAIARSQLADVLRRLGDSQGALERLEHAAHGLDRVAGEPSRLASHIAAGLAALYLDRGDAATAHGHAERAVAALDAGFDPEHPIRISALNLLARAERDLGTAARARQVAQHALAIGEASHAGEHPDLAETHRLLAELSRDDEAAARRHHERARALAPAHQQPAPHTSAPRGRMP